jgi:hypothetical protein
MDKLENFLKKNHHRVIHYFTTKDDILAFVLILSIYEGVMFMLDVRDGDIAYMETGQFQKRFYVEDMERQEFPPCLREQPAEDLIRDKKLLCEALKILQKSPNEGTLLVLGPEYMLDVARDGTFVLSKLIDFPETLEQHGIFQKYDLEYFYTHKNTISQNVKTIYSRMHQNFLDNLEHIQAEWTDFSKDPSRHLSGIQSLLVQYDERMRQCEELKRMVMDMYKLWKQLSSEHDMMEIQVDPVSFDQTLQQNHKKQLLYRKLDRIRLIEKHSTDLLVKIHIACTCLMFYMHILSCEMGGLHFRIDNTVKLQNDIQKYVLKMPSSM